MQLKYLINLIRRKETMQTNLEDKICIHRVRAMKMSVIPEELEVCRYNCDDNYQLNCINYKPAGETPVRKGKIAYELSKSKWRP